MEPTWRDVWRSLFELIRFEWCTMRLRHWIKSNSTETIKLRLRNLGYVERKISDGTEFRLGKSLFVIKDAP